MASLLTIDDLTVRFGGVAALDGVSLRVECGEICGLIGPNGAGKTTVFNCVSRLQHPDGGRIEFAGRDVLRLRPQQVARLGLARTRQRAAVFPSLTVRRNVELGGWERCKSGFLASSLRLPPARRAQRALANEANALLERLGLAPLADRLPAELPHATRKRVELARALLQRPSLLLLDEPAGGLSAAEVADFRCLLRSFRDDDGISVLVVEHRMDLVMEVCDRVVVLDSGHNLAEGPPAAVQRDPAVLGAYLGTE